MLMSSPFVSEVPALLPRKSQAARRLEMKAERERVREFLVGRAATIAELAGALHMAPLHVHELLRTMKRQSVVVKYDENAYTLTGQEPQRKPRDVKPKGGAWSDGIPRRTTVPAKQVGVERDPLVAALFGPGPGQHQAA